MNIIILLILLGIVVVVALVVIGLIVILVLRGTGRKTQKVRDDFERAIPATAKVIRLGESVNAGDFDTVDVNVTFEVFPPSDKPYKVKTTWSVDPASVSKIQVGDTVSIRIDPDNPRKIYSAEVWAQSLEMMQNNLDDSDD